MTDIKLHIISFNIPYPPNYGGVIDVFYKIKSLHALGVKIILHCYTYGREQSYDLEQHTEATYYYPRKIGISNQLSLLPYIVKSRSSDLLLSRLLKDDYPILFEGLHSCYFLNHPKLSNRIKIVRTHNIEHDYYNGLYQQERKIQKRIFFKIEALKLEHYERILEHATHIASISEKDQTYFEEKYGNTLLLSPFHSNEEVTIDVEQGKYALYHGNLEVAENVEAALFLIDAFENETELRLIIAGNNPNPLIVKAINNIRHIELIIAPTKMKDLISHAQVNILPTFQPTGVKLKLLEALYSGKHLLCNKHMISGTGLAEVCHLAESKVEFVSEARKLMKERFCENEIEKRAVILNQKFGTKKNASKIIDLIKK